MAVKIKGSYVGELRCQLEHGPSSTQILTDAPLDNNGKGEAFSPTDLVAAALGSCMVTIIAIRAKARKINISSPQFFIEKNMSSNPRKIDQIKIVIELNQEINETDRTFLEKEAKNCPVALSLSEKLTQEIHFKYV